jgi:transcriptional regulator with XRE-family HTH domain
MTPFRPASGRPASGRSAGERSAGERSASERSASGRPASDRSASQNVAVSRGGPAVVRLLLGAQLRRLRESGRITRADAGYQIRASAAKISRLENGRIGLKERDIADLLAFYGVDDEEERAAVLALAGRANAKGWWAEFSGVVPDWFEIYVGLEQAASLIRAYEVQFLPGLLQTEDYARSVAILGHPAEPAEQIERRVRLRLMRQGLLNGPDPPDLWVVVDEAALRRPIGGRQVMRTQLEHLIRVSDRPNVAVQIMPFRRGGHAAAGGSFTILRLAEPDLPDVVYLEQLTSALYLEKTGDLEHYTRVMDRLSAQAEPQEDTARILERIIGAI